jgi:hypothetical protein
MFVCILKFLDSVHSGLEYDLTDVNMSEVSVTFVVYLFETVTNTLTGQISVNFIKI